MKQFFPEQVKHKPITLIEVKQMILENYWRSYDGEENKGADR